MQSSRFKGLKNKCVNCKKNSVLRKFFLDKGAFLAYKLPLFLVLFLELRLKENSKFH